MEKAFDLKELGAILKKDGLDIAEESLKILVLGVLTWTEGAVIKSANKYDDMLLAALPLIKKRMLKLIDKIDGEKDL